MADELGEKSAISSIPGELATTLQTAHLRRDPNLQFDAAPSTAADKKVVVVPDPDDEPHDDADNIDEDDIPYSVLSPAPRPRQLPPLPDLRFEQSYLRSIAGADTWWKVVLITTRDQVIMPLAQGLIYNLLLCGWQQWNRNARLHGNSVGARVRRWWYGVNKWPISKPHHSMR
ncbi:hypothetical protein RJ55_01340 [Drechmeria coniospora]|nr:hypothetical protein RJ55_01340 [Drechmeria coniospora]